MARTHIRILLIEDNPGDVRLIREMLSQGTAATQFELESISRLEDGLDLLRQGLPFDLVLLDLSLPDSKGLGSLDRIQELNPSVAIVVLSGLDDEEVAVEAVNRGAQDYLIKGQVEEQLLIRALRYAIERKTTEQALRAAVQAAETEKAKTDAIVAGMGCGICIVDPDFKISYQNQISIALEGMRIGNYCHTFCRGKETVCNDCPVEMAFEDGQNHTVSRQITVDGQPRHLEITASPLRDANGRIMGGIKVINDVTERIQAASSMAKLSYQNELLLNSAGEGIISLDSEGRHTFVNPAASRMLEYSIDEMLGQSSHEMWHHTQADGTPYPGEDCPIYAAIKQGTAKRVDDEVFWRKDGSFFPVEYMSTPIIEQGKPAGAVVTFLNITKRKEAEESLRRSEERYRDLFENANDLIQAVNPEGRFLYVNRAWRQALGYSEEDLAGITLFDVLCKEGQGNCRELFAEVLQGRDIDRVEAIFITKDKRQIIVEGSVSARSENGRIVSSRGIFRDITDRKRMEREREQMQAQLLQAQKLEAIGTLAGGVAHDFNNLLTTIQGYADLAIRSSNGKSPFQNELKAITDACRRAVDIVRQLLLFSRKQVMELKPLNVNTAVTNLLKMLHRLIGEDIVIRTELAPEIKAVSADAGNLDQVIMNLVVNARDAMHNGGEILISTDEVEIDPEYCKGVPRARPGHFIRLTVADTGSGLERDIIDHIFEPFFTTKDTGKGTGLGLSVVYGIVEQHKGWMTVESEPGKGSKFNIFLPALAGRCHIEENPIFPMSTLMGKGERILLVEDDSKLKDLARTALEKNGYVVFAAETGAEAIALFEQERGDFQILFSDVVLPDINGVRLAETFRELNPGLKILLSSGYTAEKSQQAVIEAKQYPFLEKPFTLNSLLRIMKEL